MFSKYFQHAQRIKSHLSKIKKSLIKTAQSTTQLSREPSMVGKENSLVIENTSRPSWANPPVTPAGKIIYLKTADWVEPWITVQNSYLKSFKIRYKLQLCFFHATMIRSSSKQTDWKRIFRNETQSKFSIRFIMYNKIKNIHRTGNFWT